MRLHFGIAAKDKVRATVPLTMGCVAFLLGLHFVAFQTSFDSWIPRSSDVFRIGMGPMSTNQTVDISSLTPAGLGPLADQLNNDIAQMVRITQSNSVQITVDTDANPKFIDSNLVYADEKIIEFFGLHVIKGNPEEALKAPDGLILTQNFAHTLFGHDLAINDLVGFRDGKKARVMAVIEDLPQNSHLEFDAIRSLSTSKPDVSGMRQWFPSLFTYIRTKPSVSKDAIAKLQNLYDAQSPIPATFYLRPVRDIQFNSNALTRFKPATNALAIWAIFGVSFAVLGFGLSTYASFTTVVMAQRVKEIGLLKTLGADPKELLLGFALEATITSAITFLLALVIVALIVIVGGESVQKWIPTTQLAHLPTLGLGFLFVLLVTSATMLVSAHTTAHARAAHLLSYREGEIFGGNGLGMWVMVVVQYCVVFIAAIFSATIIFQINFGYLQTNSMLIKDRWSIFFASASDDAFAASIYGDEQLARKLLLLSDELRRDPSVKNISLANSILPTPFLNTSSLRVPGSDAGKVNVQGLAIDPHFQDMFELHVLSGRFFSYREQSDMIAPNREGAQGSIILSVAASKAFGFANSEDAIGKIVETSSRKKNKSEPAIPIKLKIIGVVEDVNFQTSRNQPSPIYYIWDPDVSLMFFVRVHKGQIDAFKKALLQAQVKYFPDFDINLRSLTSTRKQLQTADFDLLKSFLTFTVFGIVIVGFSIFGLTRVMVGRQSQEIALRKLYGASKGALTGLLLTRFMQPMFLGFLFAVIPAWWASSRWLSDFPIRVDITLGMFAIPGLLLSLFTILVVTLAVWNIHAQRLAKTFAN